MYMQLSGLVDLQVLGILKGVAKAVHVGMVMFPALVMVVTVVMVVLLALVIALPLWWWWQ